MEAETTDTTPQAYLRKRLLSGGSWALVGKLSTAALGILVSSLITRLLLPEEVGVYFLSLSVVYILAMLSQSGLSQAIVRLIAESVGKGNPSRAWEYVRFVFVGVGVGSLVVTAGLHLGLGKWLAFEVFDLPLMGEVIGLITIWIVVVAFQTLVAEAFRGYQDIRFAVIFGGLGKNLLLAGLLSILWLLNTQVNLRQLLALTVIAIGLSDLLGATLLKRKTSLSDYDTSNSAKSPINVRAVLAISVPLLITNLLIMLLGQADIWILGAFRSSEEVGIYGAVARLVVLIAMPLSVANAITPPLIAELNARKELAKLESFLRATATLAALPAALVLLVFILIGPLILRFLFGPYYQQGATILIILAIGQFMNVGAGSCMFALAMTGEQKTAMVITSIAGVTSVTLALLLVQRYGGVGVAFSFAVAMILHNALMLVAVKKKLGVWTHVQFSLRTARSYWRMLLLEGR